MPLTGSELTILIFELSKTLMFGVTKITVKYFKDISMCFESHKPHTHTHTHTHTH